MRQLPGALASGKAPTGPPLPTPHLRPCRPRPCPANSAVAPLLHCHQSCRAADNNVGRIAACLHGTTPVPLPTGLSRGLADNETVPTNCLLTGAPTCSAQPPHLRKSQQQQYITRLAIATII